MADVFKTITVTAANRQAAKDAISNAGQDWSSQGPNCFLGQRTTLQDGTIATHYLMSGDIPEGMAALFAADGPAASITMDYSDQAWMDVCARLGLYPVITD